MNGALEFRHCVTNNIDNTGMRATTIFGKLLDAIRDVGIITYAEKITSPFPATSITAYRSSIMSYKIKQVVSLSLLRV